MTSEAARIGLDLDWRNGLKPGASERCHLGQRNPVANGLRADPSQGSRVPRASESPPVMSFSFPTRICSRDTPGSLPAATSDLPGSIAVIHNFPRFDILWLGHVKLNLTVSRAS